MVSEWYILDGREVRPAASYDFMKSIEEVTGAFLQLNIVVRDRLTPALQILAVFVGRFALDWYMTWPWYRRLWYDLRTGRFFRNVVEAVRAL